MCGLVLFSFIHKNFIGVFVVSLEYCNLFCVQFASPSSLPKAAPPPRICPSTFANSSNDDDDKMVILSSSPFHDHHILVSSKYFSFI
jgi:hypothetical protein